MLANNPAPESVEGIDKKLANIVGDKYEKLTSKVVDNFNNMAMHGNVPSDLFDSEVEYWIMIANQAVCEYDENCNVQDLRNVVLAKQISDGASYLPLISEMVDYFIQEAFAYTGQFHYATVYGDPLGGCDYGTCLISKSNSGTGQITTSVNSGSGHGIGKYLKAYGSACGTNSAATDQADVTAYVGINSWNKKVTNYPGCAISSATHQVANNPSATWLWTVTNISDSWT